MCTFLRDLERTRAIKKYVYIAAVLLLLINMIFGTTINGSTNWVRIAGMTFQPSELVKLAFIWVGAATMDELFDRKSSLRFSAFAVFCFLCLAKIGDLGAAAIFFATYLVISFLRSGDFARLLSIGGVAFVAALLVLKFRSYAVDRLNTWGHIWEPDFINNSGFQQTRSLTDAASGGLIGLGAGRGNLRFINASETDMVFCFLAEEWGLPFHHERPVHLLYHRGLFRYDSVPAADHPERVRQHGHPPLHRGGIPLHIGRRDLHDCVLGASGLSEGGGYQAECKHRRVPEGQGRCRRR